MTPALFGLPLWAYELIGGGIFFFAVAGLLTGYQKATPDSAQIPYIGQTKLKLLFSGFGKAAAPLEAENIFRWFVLDHVGMEAQKKGKLKSHRISCTIFIIFEKPINPTYLRVAFNVPNAPPVEVKDFAQRSAVVVINGDVPSGILEISVDRHQEAIKS